MIEKGTAMVTHLDGNEVHAMNMKDHSMMILPLEDGMNIEAGKEIMWMEALDRFNIIRDHLSSFVGLFLKGRNFASLRYLPVMYS